MSKLNSPASGEFSAPAKMCLQEILRPIFSKYIRFCVSLQHFWNVIRQDLLGAARLKPFSTHFPLSCEILLLEIILESRMALQYFSPKKDLHLFIFRDCGCCFVEFNMTDLFQRYWAPLNASDMNEFDLELWFEGRAMQLLCHSCARLNNNDLETISKSVCWMQLQPFRWFNALHRFYRMSTSVLAG